MPLEQWDAKALHAKQVATRVILEKKRNDILLFEERMRAEGQYITIEDIKNFNSGKSNLKPERQSFFTYFQEYIQRIEKGIDKGEINKETIAKYKTTYKILKEYKSEFCICDISYNLIENFDLYMTEVRGNAPGGRYNKHKNLRSVILDIIKHGIPVKNPYDTFKIPQPSVKDIYLNLQELDSMRGLRSKLSHKSTDYKILQMYLFSCYCGLRFSDVIGLKWNEINFSDGVIQRKMIKTKRLVITPLFGHAKALLLEISNSKRLLGSEKNVFHSFSSTSVNKTLEKLSNMANIDKHITFHTVTHTFTDLYKFACN